VPPARNFATGLTSFIFDPDYTNNGIFYTLHMEDPSTAAPAEPRAGVVPGLDVARTLTARPVIGAAGSGRNRRRIGTQRARQQFLRGPL
jgi:hypothetical protein